MYKLKHSLNTNSSKEVLVINGQHEYEEILDILDIIQNNVQLVYVSMKPIVNYKVQGLGHESSQLLSTDFIARSSGRDGSEYNENNEPRDFYIGNNVFKNNTKNAKNKEQMLLIHEAQFNKSNVSKMLISSTYSDNTKAGILTKNSRNTTMNNTSKSFLNNPIVTPRSPDVLYEPTSAIFSKEVVNSRNQLTMPAKVAKQSFRDNSPFEQDNDMVNQEENLEKILKENESSPRKLVKMSYKSIKSRIDMQRSPSNSKHIPISVQTTDATLNPYDDTTKDIKTKMSTNKMYREFNKNSIKKRNTYDVVDQKYVEFFRYFGKDIDEFVESTPFSRPQIYDFYSKFKALSKLCIENQQSKINKKERFKRKRRQREIVQDVIRSKNNLKKERRLSGSEAEWSSDFDDAHIATPKQKLAEQFPKYRERVLLNNKRLENVGIHMEEFKQGLKECRLYNQGILEKIFYSLDEDEKGYLNWEEFLEGMKTICSNSLEDKIDCFLRMADDEANGSFSYDEIKDICILTLEDGIKKSNKAPQSSQSSSSDSPLKILNRYSNDRKDIDILDETADFQAENIFRILGYDLEDEIPVEDFKRGIFEGDIETQHALKQFCCIDNE